MSITSRSSSAASSVAESSRIGGEREEQQPLTEEKQHSGGGGGGDTAVRRRRRRRSCCWWPRSAAARCVAVVAILALAQCSLQWLVLYQEEMSKIPRGMTNARGRGWVRVPWQRGRAFDIPNSKQQHKIMQQNNERFRKVFNNENHTITLSDLADLQFEDELPEQTWEEAAADRGPLLEVLRRAGQNVDVGVLQRLPTWSEVVEMYGEAPVVVGKERCAAFRESVPAERRHVGVAGQMNTGTNALAKYLSNNIQIAENPSKERGVLWTVPWYKHGWASLRHRYRYREPEDHDTVLAVVTVREPMFWMQSMCESPYTMEWNKSSTHCPNLVEGPPSLNETTPVRVRWSKDYIRKWPSMADLWSSWHREYYDSDMPRLMVRFEDMLFHTEQVVEEIRDCVGAEWRHPEFQFQAAPAKTHPYFAKYKPPSSLVSAMIKYGWDIRARRVGTMTAADREFARQHLDADLLEQFHYPRPDRRV